MFQILINREEKENFFFKILKMEKRKRMKIQFFRARGSERGQYFSRFLEIRDSCPCLMLHAYSVMLHTSSEEKRIFFEHFVLSKFVSSYVNKTTENVKTMNINGKMKVLLS